jgi:hypothetical protein
MESGRSLSVLSVINSIQHGLPVKKHMCLYLPLVWDIKTSTEHINSTSHWQIMFVEKLINNDYINNYLVYQFLDNLIFDQFIQVI